MGQIPIKQRELLLVPFPFSDQSGRKIRPVIVISNDAFNETSDDVIAVGVTSNMSRDKYTILLTPNNLDEGKLFSRCSIKVENILKLDKSLIIKKIGLVNNEILKNIASTLFSIVKS